jgi:hypothetical protein
MIPLMQQRPLVKNNYNPYGLENLLMMPGTAAKLIRPAGAVGL